MLHCTCKQANMLRVQDTFSVHFPFFLFFSLVSCFLVSFSFFLVFGFRFFVCLFVFFFYHGKCFWNSHIRVVVYIS